MQLGQREVPEDQVDLSGPHVLVDKQRSGLSEMPAAERAEVVGELDQRHRGVRIA
jgi:hypothetical protein